MLGVFAAAAALCGALAPWAVLPLVTAACWACYDGFAVHHGGTLGWRTAPDLRALALIAAVALLARVLSGPVERAFGRRGAAQWAAVEANPLFRGVDRSRRQLRRHRARLPATSLGLGLVVALGVHAQSTAAADAAQHRGHAVVATTLADALPPPGTKTAARGGGATVVGVQAAWQYPAGARHTGRVVVFRRQAAGTQVTVWVDDAGRLVATPLSASDRLAASALAGVSAAAAAVLLSALGCRLARRRLDVRAARAWAEDWARVEPYWSGRKRNEDVGGGR